MGRDLAEGHVHALERQLALAKTALEDMRRTYLQLEDVTQQLDGEAEDLQAQVGAHPERGPSCLYDIDVWSVMPRNIRLGMPTPVHCTSRTDELQQGVGATAHNLRETASLSLGAMHSIRLPAHLFSCAQSVFKRRC